MILNKLNPSAILSSKMPGFQSLSKSYIEIYVIISSNIQNSIEVKNNLQIQIIYNGCEQNSIVSSKSKWKFSFQIGPFCSKLLTLLMKYVWLLSLMQICFNLWNFCVNDITYVTENKMQKIQITTNWNGHHIARFFTTLIRWSTLKWPTL